MRCVPTLLAATLVAAFAGEARADWPCADNIRFRVVHAKTGNPIAITTANDRPVYGDFKSLDLNNDGKQDLFFHSACIRGPVDSVRLHRVFASCGPAADGVEDLVMIFEDEELCARTLELSTQVQQSKVGGVLWQDLLLTRKLGGTPCERTREILQFDGERYKSGPRTTLPCTKR